MSKAIQVCGTGSGVGKSVLVAALCRIFRQDGYDVAPFKAQNMALNSYVTRDGGEIGRAQAMQAEAAKITPTVDMNPILLKPTRDTGAQVIVRGNPLANMSALRYTKAKAGLNKIVKDSYGNLSRRFDIVVIEGAGSIAEINLKKHDIVNTAMARTADAPIIIAADIDKGGVFASLVGTMELLTPDERKQVAGFIINKFRGDKRLLKGGLDFLEKRTRKKVLGVVPFFGPDTIRLPEEDSVSLERLGQRGYERGKINIDVLYLPHISNFTDFDALEKEPMVNLNYIRDINEIAEPDVLIIPGSKNTISDLAALRKAGLAKKLDDLLKRRCVIVGICGGYQMLGKVIRDKNKIESKCGNIKGLGLLDIYTEFRGDKSTFQVKARHMGSGLLLKGYEIHHGRSRLLDGSKPLFKITRRNSRDVSISDGASNKAGNVWGTYIHGVFDNDPFRRHFITRLCAAKGLARKAGKGGSSLNGNLDKLARLVRKNVDMKEIYRLLNS